MQVKSMEENMLLQKQSELWRVTWNALLIWLTLSFDKRAVPVLRHCALAV